MDMGDAFINRLAVFLPNNPVSNDEMEDYLGLIKGRNSKSKGIVLRNNGIKTRYYALDKEGRSTHDNVDITVEAIKKLFDKDFDVNDIELLTCGTTSPDVYLPSHASMVHGKLGGKAIQVISPMGSCNTGVLGLYHAWLSIISGQTNNAVCTGSEKLSDMMHSINFEEEADSLEKLGKNPFIAFEKDFLRWMLSDGAAAVLVEKKPRGEKPLRIEHIFNQSFAHKVKTCMYLAGEKDEKGEIQSWKRFSRKELSARTLFSLKQDVKLLEENIVKQGIECLKNFVERYNVDINKIDYFLPHISSEFFREKVYQGLQNAGMGIPYDKWFTNLSSVGNIGSASAFFMLEELMRTRNPRKGEKIFLMIPESARFSYTYILLTVEK